MKVIFNPRCTKCRILRNALDSNEVAWESVLYLEGALERTLVEQIFASYAGSWHDLIRTKEMAFKEAGVKLKELSKEEAIELVLKKPVILQRPIIVRENQVLIARDDETVACVLAE